MSEEIDVVGSLGGSKSQGVVIVVRGKASPACLEEFVTGMKALAKKCKLSVKSLKVSKEVS